MIGYLAYDDARRAASGVLVVHDWIGWGLRQEEGSGAGGTGLRGLAVDMYGGGLVAADQEEAAGWREPQGEPDRDARAGPRRPRGAGNAAPGRPGQAGRDRFCFGGTTVLELRAAGAGRRRRQLPRGLATPDPADAKNIKGKVLVCTARTTRSCRRPRSPPSRGDATREGRLAAGRVRRRVHSFTNPRPEPIRRAARPTTSRPRNGPGADEGLFRRDLLKTGQGSAQQHAGPRDLRRRDPDLEPAGPTSW